MAATQRNHDDDPISEINMIPFIDILLVLLIIFMATASLTKNKIIPVSLPKAASGDSMPEKSMAITKTKDQKIYLNGHEITYEKLNQSLKQEKTKHKNLQILISADESLPYKDVIKLVDLVRIHGVSNYALNIQSQE